MSVTDLGPQLDRLDGDLDELEEALAPLLQDLGEASSRLPLLDKAKLNILATYALESLLFCMAVSRA
jgi:exosome complex protein LRP1